MRTIIAALCVAAVAFGVSPACAQTKLGEVLDKRATKLTAEEFRQEIVGRYVEGPGRAAQLQWQGSEEIIYLNDRSIRGSGRASNLGGAAGGGATYSIEGTWSTDDRDRICQSLKVGNFVLAPRCQYWFKESDRYFVADSDTDRSAWVVIRTLKKI